MSSQHMWVAALGATVAFGCSIINRFEDYEHGADGGAGVSGHSAGGEAASPSGGGGGLSLSGEGGDGGADVLDADRTNSGGVPAPGGAPNSGPPSAGAAGAGGSAGGSVAQTSGAAGDAEPNQGTGGSAAPSSCMISSVTYPSESSNPENQCLVCRPSESTNSWSLMPDGSSCGSGRVCRTGACQAGCWLGGAFHAEDALDPGNPCQACQPLVSTSEWTALSDGTACDTGKACHSGVCEGGCGIGSSYYEEGTGNPENPCQSCRPAESSTTWTDAPTATCVQGVSAGGYHTCAIVNGGVWCWGDNRYGQLGSGAITDVANAVPVQVQGLTTGVQAVAAGQRHTCAVVDGSAWCWGSNEFRQLGVDSDTLSVSSVPLQQPHLTSGVQTIASGVAHTCSMGNGVVRCWGSNQFGQLGEDPVITTGSSTPVRVQGLAAQAMAAGDYHNCAIANGAVSCWGRNTLGALGVEPAVTPVSSVPLQIAGLASGAQTIAAGGNHNCAMVNGSAQCWGNNDESELGNPSAIVDFSMVPVQVQGLTSGVGVVAAAQLHTCAIANGDVWCWGSNANGRLGDGSVSSFGVAVQPEHLPAEPQLLDLGTEHTCVVASGRLWCWGGNAWGQLGNNSSEESHVAVQVEF